MRFPLAALLLCFVLITTTIVIPTYAQAPPLSNGPDITEQFQFDLGWSVENSLNWAGEISAFGLGVSAGFFYDYFAGVSAPLSMNVTRPDWVVPDSSFNVSILATGETGGRAGVYFNAGMKLTLFNPFDSWDVIDIQRTLDLMIDYTTPIGDVISRETSYKMSIGEVTIPIIDYTIDVYVGASAEVRFQTDLCSDFIAYGSSLVNSMDCDMEWTENGAIVNRSLMTKSSASQSVTIAIRNTRLTLRELSLAVTELFIELNAPGFDPVKLGIDIPDIVVPIVGDSQSPIFHPSSETPNRVADLELEPFDIPVRRPEIVTQNHYPSEDVILSTMGFVLLVVFGVVILTYFGIRRVGSH